MAEGGMTMGNRGTKEGSRGMAVGSTLGNMAEEAVAVRDMSNIVIL